MNLSAGWKRVEDELHEVSVAEGQLTRSARVGVFTTSNTLLISSSRSTPVQCAPPRFQCALGVQHVSQAWLAHSHDLRIPDPRRFRRSTCFRARCATAAPLSAHSLLPSPFPRTQAEVLFQTDPTMTRSLHDAPSSPSLCAPTPPRLRNNTPRYDYKPASLAPVVLSMKLVELKPPRDLDHAIGRVTSTVHQGHRKADRVSRFETLPSIHFPNPYSSSSMFCSCPLIMLCTSGKIPRSATCIWGHDNGCTGTSPSATPISLDSAYL